MKLHGGCLCGGMRYEVDGQLASLAIGGLDEDPDIRPAYHMYVASKAPWHEITDALPQFPDGPPPGGLP